MSTAVYAAAYPIYRDRGWSPIKLHAGTKSPPPAGFTGHDGIHPSGADMYAWAEDEPDGNLAVRLGDSFAGIDVDDYDGKGGGKTIAEAERRWGALPYTPRSSSRVEDPVSGIRIYKIPGWRQAGHPTGVPRARPGRYRGLPVPSSLRRVLAVGARQDGRDVPLVRHRWRRTRRAASGLRHPRPATDVAAGATGT